MERRFYLLMRYVVLLIPTLLGGWAAWHHDLILGGATLFSLTLLLFLRWPSDWRALARTAAQKDRQLAQQRSEMQARIDLLSAEREISLILNEDVDFKTILDKVLAITADTLGGDEVEIYLKDGDELAPRAARVGGRTVFAWTTRPDPLLAAVLENGRRVMTAEGDRLRVLSPLSRDRELVGVVRFTTTPDRADRLPHALDELSKFLALALKTPDLYTRAVEDALTGLASKRHFLTQLAAAVDAARRYQEPLALIMVDVDHFKKVNDTYGHVAGDKVLKGVAECIRKGVRRAGDAYSGYRYGGEEMVVLMPKTPAERAAAVAERLRLTIEEKKFVIDRKQSIHVTASLGVAVFNLSMEDGTELVKRADEALYQAKEGGRNRVVIGDRELSSVRRTR